MIPNIKNVYMYVYMCVCVCVCVYIRMSCMCTDTLHGVAMGTWCSYTVKI